ncbi:MAG: hypothetical protein KDI18_09910 [Gammaproteobacteria bacterium]|nr:hypothetical protein [Gammaproteobacteria bacterium]MCB1904385.1 hypothetical protein [Gammaproteobacteria bacterium]MCP5428108.1 hypothetical protein [Chromatiaceae bacterium]
MLLLREGRWITNPAKFLALNSKIVAFPAAVILTIYVKIYATRPELKFTRLPPLYLK